MNTIDCLDLSYPDLHFLSYLVAHDMMVYHRKYFSSLEPALLSPLKNTVPLFHLDFTQDGGYSNIGLVDAMKGKSPLPFPAGHALHKDWLLTFSKPSKGKLDVPVLITTPRGARGTAQIMTAIVHLSLLTERRYQTEGVEIRWLHCK